MWRRYFLLTLFVLTVGAGCLGSGNKTKKDQADPDNISQNNTAITVDSLKSQSDIKKFSSIDEFKNYIKDNELAGRGDYGGSSLPRMMMAEDASFGVGASSLGNVESGSGMAMMKSVAMPSLSMDSAGSSDFSKTNVQVEGVDEADIIKTDGKYVYALVKNELHIIVAHPPEEARDIATIVFKSRPQDLYVSGDRLVVFGAEQNYYDFVRERHFRRYSPYTFFKVFDISDRSNPVEKRDLNFEGSYTNSRMIGDYVYFITSNDNYSILEEDAVLPRILDGEDALSYTPDIYYFGIPYQSYNLTSINSINIQDDDEPIKGDAYVMDYGQNIYVSPDNMYITYGKYLDMFEVMLSVLKELIYPLLSVEDKVKIQEIESMPSHILTKLEKNNKISQYFDKFIYSKSDNERKDFSKEMDRRMKDKVRSLKDELQMTVVHKINVKKGDIIYQTHGSVQGQVLNQFSMDERDGIFRIATTRDVRWTEFLDEGDRDTYSNIFTLDENLNQLGAIREIAKGERIFSVRYIGDRAYMVTFEQVDPLFVIDLSDARNPQILGELKIPGFSNYLHPYDNDTLIGLGRDTSLDDEGNVRVKGLKLSLFDVSDVTAPKEVDTYLLGDSGSSSVAEYDHKAFLFSLEKNLLAIPVSIMEDRPSPDGKSSYPQFTFSGSVVFDVNKNGFKLKGKIDHSEGKNVPGMDYWGGYNYYDNNVKRNLYIDDVLISFSNQFLKMNALSDLKEIKSIKFQVKEKDFEIITPYAESVMF